MTEQQMSQRATRSQEEPQWIIRRAREPQGATKEQQRSSMEEWAPKLQWDDVIKADVATSTCDTYLPQPFLHPTPSPNLPVSTSMAAPEPFISAFSSSGSSPHTHTRLASEGHHLLLSISMLLTHSSPHDGRPSHYPPPLLRFVPLWIMYMTDSKRTWCPVVQGKIDVLVLTRSWWWVRYKDG